MRTLALFAFLGCAAIAQAQQPKTYTPETAPRPNEETVLNARVVSVDVAGARLTVRGVDVKADGGRDETFSVAPPAASRLGELNRGTEVLLRLRGTTVVEVKASIASGVPGNANAGVSTRGQAECGSDALDDRNRPRNRQRAHERARRHHAHGITVTRGGPESRRTQGEPGLPREREAGGAAGTPRGGHAAAGGDAGTGSRSPAACADRYGLAAAGSGNGRGRSRTRGWSRRSRPGGRGWRSDRGAVTGRVRNALSDAAATAHADPGRRSSCRSHAAPRPRPLGAATVTGDVPGLDADPIAAALVAARSVEIIDIR